MTPDPSTRSSWWTKDRPTTLLSCWSATRGTHGIEVIRNDPPRGLSGARNTGIAATDAPFVTWIDDDDLTSPDRIARQLEALRSGPWRWSCAARVDVDDDLQVIGHVRCPTPDGLLAQVLGRNVLPSAGQGLLVERSLLDEVGTFDESLDSAEDWDFAIRLAESGPGHMLDEPLVGYRTGFASMSTDTDRMERTIARCRGSLRRPVPPRGCGGRLGRDPSEPSGGRPAQLPTPCT
ncbi:MAG: glycosyltransferase [Microthrixaceae bacterium]